MALPKSGHWMPGCAMRGRGPSPKGLPGQRKHHSNPTTRYKRKSTGYGRAESTLSIAHAWRSCAMVKEKNRQGGGKVEASVARCLRTPPESANPQEFRVKLSHRLRGETCFRIVVVCNYKIGPITVATMPSENTVFTPSSILFRPRRGPSQPPSRVAFKELGGGAGYRPRVR